MVKRGIICGDYDTAAQGWTLCECKLSQPEQQTNFIPVPGGIPLDVSTTLTEGEPAYNGRTLTARLECSEGNRLWREGLISDMVNQLDGYRLDIVLPDHPEHYITGRVSVTPDYNDPAHASVTVTATCDPWRYAAAEQVYRITATEAEQVAELVNNGRLAVVPVVTVSGDAASVTLTDGANRQVITAGTWQLPWLYLRHGKTRLTYSGAGRVQITYREAVL